MSIIFSLPAKERIVADLEPEPEEAETCLDFHIDSAKQQQHQQRQQQQCKGYSNNVGGDDGCVGVGGLL